MIGRHKVLVFLFFNFLTEESCSPKEHPCLCCCQAIFSILGMQTQQELQGKVKSKSSCLQEVKLLQRD